jgi:hypothetical protein
MGWFVSRVGYTPFFVALGFGDLIGATPPWALVRRPSPTPARAVVAREARARGNRRVAGGKADRLGLIVEAGNRRGTDPWPRRSRLAVETDSHLAGNNFGQVIYKISVLRPT